MSRIPLATDLKTRTGAPDKDARLKNCYVEVRGDQSAVRRRASCQSDGDVIVAGTAQGGIGLTINGTDLVVTVNGDDIVMGSGSIGGGGGYIGTQPVSLADPNVSDINWMLLIPYCDEADILAAYPTDDKGTSVYAGPAETAYTVPQTTVTRTIHGETPCGQLLIKTVTKTYSARTVENQFKYTYQGYAGYSSISALDTPRDDGIQWNLLAASLPQVVNGATQVPLSGCPDNPVYASHYTTGIYTIYCSNNNGCAGGSSGCASVRWAQSTLTLYYLDVHEVWTYSVI